ncbi:hypothetical protein K2173_022294 [Erythroxylum novogranatense]|uniref:J domain-containing protein n=1 Tax=Erythroxylum novogranatense TaxID=1862640 RepID=A0AAV8TIZ0_9ROSI|nr:hypothetical protein K2173_022294 [Erythroxylum novogranatense]
MMDCYKEEAIRVKADAESKMQSKDFIAARKIALNAQHIYKDLENISQILTICDVHCAAEKKLLGSETDWYGILQVEETVDEALIKKQYRKFALQLHPDKNRYPGAEAAFKLIGEAQRVLLDKGKRSLHDIKRKTSESGKFPQHKRPQKATFTANCGGQNNPGGNFTGAKYQHQQPMQGVPRSASPNSCAIFWTACPFCNVKYKYCLDVVNKFLLCQFCRKTFVAYEKSWHGATTLNLNQATFTQRKDALDRVARRVELSNQRVVNGEHLKTTFSPKGGCDTEFCSGKENGKRLRKKDLESSESSDTKDEDDMLVDDDGDFKAKVKFECHGEGPRRSHRPKQQVSYDENVSDDEKFGSRPKKTKGGVSSCATNKQKADGLMGDGSETNKQSNQDGNQEDENKAKEVDPSTIDPKSPATSEPETFAYDEPDFNDFDKLRDEKCFSEGQVWALYDPVDAMPRFYALIRIVFSSVFKLRITWLEPVPDDKSEVEWINEDLPISCGKYKHGNSETIDQRLMFSHVVPYDKNKPNGPYKIYPTQGETWALFKNWDIKWKLDADTHRKYDYEFVEILSDFNEDVGVCVAYLHKLKGFVGVFCRLGEESFQIPSAELLRFSHMIPSFQLAGKERERVPKGSFELDPASLPQIIEEITIPVDIGEFAGSDHTYSSSKSSFDEVKKSEEKFAANRSAQATKGA